MQFLDRTGVGTLWSMCKTKFALKDHSHNYLPLSGGTLTGDLLFSNSGTTFRQIRGTCGDNDFWRIGGGATRNNAGYMEIATADDGTEPIYVRQYSGTFGTITRTATLLDDSGNTSFPGTVAAAKFKGALEGNASTASNAATVNGYTVNANVPANAKFTDTNTWRGIQDNLTSSSTSDSLSANQGRVLKGLIDSKADSSDLSSYAQKSDAVKNISSIINKNLTGYGEQILKITYASNSLGEVKISDASNNSNGFMSISDKQKLDGIASGANNYTLPAATTDNLGGVRVSTSYGQYKNNPWPIYVNRDGKIYTDIRGLGDNGQNSISYIELTEENTTTRYSNKRITLFPSESYEQTIDLPTKSGTLALTSDIPTKTSQLTNDSTFLTSADKYTLPTASAGTLGGIKVSENTIGTLYPITVNDNGFAYASILGINKNSIDNTIKNIIFKNNDYSTTYTTTAIQMKNISQNKLALLKFPSESGTLALTSDIPDVPDISDLFVFNFVNSISECITGTINLLFVSASLTIDLSDLDNFEDGVIIFLAKINGSANVYVNHTSGAWFSDGVKRNEEYRRAIPTSASIVTVRNGTVYVLI